MTSRMALFALLGMWGVGACGPALAETSSSMAPATDGAPGASFTDRVWLQAGTGDALPGVMQVFLSDGTLVTDSCWETYRLSEWKQVGARTLVWTEDGVDIGAEIVSVSDAELVLRLGDGPEQRFIAADAPYVCPDMEG